MDIVEYQINLSAFFDPYNSAKKKLRTVRKKESKECHTECSLIKLYQRPKYVQPGMGENT